MGITYFIDEESSALYEKWEGPLRREDVANYWRFFSNNAKAIACTRNLVDIRDAEILFTGEELEKLVHDYLLPLAGIAETKTAILVAQPVQIGVSRQYQVFKQTTGEDALFSDETEAWAWLGLPEDPGVWSREFRAPTRDPL